MKKTVVSTPSAPAAIGPYSQAILQEGWLFTAGQMPVDPATGEVKGDDIASQTGQVLENLGAVLAAAGMDFSQVVKTTVYTTDLGAFAELNRVYSDYFGESVPARSTVQVAALPKGVLVEIEAVARRD